ncbi:hypothetical protein M409DRAFT_61541 [Zasmidium cellare ATCC 36951]|uniref:Uncharacterized protein n=1 Tax=Zasmidium cellare ATCC 36951 TaxID=1080233 RepID=A0A6A6BV62_ZASCE|nr:uncharacterized protein M409DRAFT_61541 [Zasmidium cellare ATCC 36951]KAF2158565.1 hypothetical protein M409DRAFT_61541 [Zasmidium cellare ATCC 36951]
MVANTTKPETPWKIGSHSSLKPNATQQNFVKVAKAACDFTTTDKNRCGEECTAKSISVFPGYPVTQYTCMPKETASPKVFVTVTPISTVVIFPGPSTTRTEPLPTKSAKEIMSKGACGDVVREISACPINCPASVIPGGVGAVYSCVDPTATSKTSPSSTPATVEATTTPASTASSSTATLIFSSTTPATPPSSTFEIIISSTVSQDASTSSTSPPVQTLHSFEQTPAGKATIAVSLISGLLVIGLAFFFYRRHKRKVAAKNRREPETIQLRCDVANRKSDGTFSDEDSRALSIWEVLTNTTREEFHAQRGAELLKMSYSITMSTTSATPTIDAIMRGLKSRDDDDDEPTTTTRPKPQSTTSRETDEDEPSTTTRSKPQSTSSQNDDEDEPTSSPKSSTNVSSTTKKSSISIPKPTSNTPTTLSTKISKPSSSPSSTASWNPYSYPSAANTTQPSPTSAIDKKLAALRKTNTNMGIVIAVFVICFTLMAAFQIWYWCVFKPKKKVVSKGIELATGGKANGRSWFGKNVGGKVTQKVVDRFI